MKNNPVKNALESNKIKLIDANRIDDAEFMINQIQTLDNSRFAVCKKYTEDGKQKWSQWVLDKSELLNNNKLNNVLSEPDMYMSLNSFEGVRRRIVDLHSLNGFIVDLDYYKCPELKGQAPDQVIKFLRKKGLFDKLEPSFFSYSGHGLYIVYLIENANPACLKIWRKIMKALFKTFERFGADVRSLDPSHVFRFGGSKNSKTGNYTGVIYNSNKQFRFEQQQEPVRRYTIKKMAEILLPRLPYSKEEYKKIKAEKKAEKEAAQIKREEKQKRQGKNSKAKVINFHTLHSLNYNRMKDLETLQSLRKGYCVKNGNIDVEGNREFMCFLYRYWACCYYKNTKKALDLTLMFNSNFAEPLEETEVINATKSADQAYELWQKTYDSYIALDSKEKPAINKYFHDACCYIYKNETIIEELSITRSEMYRLKTIIMLDTEERNARNKEYRAEWKRQDRRNSEGLTSREQAKRENMSRIKELLELNMKQKDIAEKVNLDKSVVSRYIKEIKALEVQNSEVETAKEENVIAYESIAVEKKETKIITERSLKQLDYAYEDVACTSNDEFEDWGEVPF